MKIFKFDFIFLVGLYDLFYFVLNGCLWYVINALIISVKSVSYIFEINNKIGSRLSHINYVAFF